MGDYMIILPIKIRNVKLPLIKRPVALNLFTNIITRF